MIEILSDNEIELVNGGSPEAPEADDTGIWSGLRLPWGPRDKRPGDEPIFP